MPGEHDGEIFDRIRDLEIQGGRTDEWKGNMADRIKKLEDELPIIQKTLTRAEVRLTVIIGILIFVANWLFKH